MELSLLSQIMLIGILGIGSQWIAWKFRLPAIVIMSLAGLIVGPFLGWMNPEASFGELYSPIISVAVAIILFEGSLQLNFKELRGLGKPLFRIATFGAFIAWILGSLTAHYMAGLPWAIAFVIGGLFIVTGPTVILPLLRQSKLKPRPAKILKWEGIVVDPIGVLLAVLAFEVVSFLVTDEKSAMSLVIFFMVAFFGMVIGWLSGRFVGWSFETGVIPEFLKSPAVFIIVILTFTVSDEMVKGVGLLAVTVMGMTLANMGVRVIDDFMHFKENISVLLISAIFIMLAASLKMETIIQVFEPNIIGYVIFMMFLVRPLSIFISTINSGMTLEEKKLVGWIAPRGIVALTVSGYFATVMHDAGYAEAELLTALTFGLVIFTVIGHGFTIAPLAKRLNLSLEGKPGVLLVGSNPFTVGLAESFEKEGIPVIIVDSSWHNLKLARAAGVLNYHGELLAEQTEYNLDTIPYDFIIAATNDNAYNSLICTTFMPEYGRTNVFKVDPSREGTEADIVGRVGGRSLCTRDVSLDMFNKKVGQSYTFRSTLITEQFNYKAYVAEKDVDALFLYYVKPSGQVNFYAADMRGTPSAGDTIVSLTPAIPQAQRIQRFRKSRFN